MRYYVILLIAQVVLKHGSCQSSSKIFGDWKIQRGTLTENYGWPSFKKMDINISPDCITTQSGFFYAIDDLAVNNPSGRFPFVYYGNKEKCELKGDSIFIYNTPYKSRDAYLINFLDDNNVRLIGYKNEISLSKIHILKKIGKKREIEYVKVAIEGYDIYEVSYSVKYSKDDTMLFKGVTDSSGRVQEISQRLTEGSFEEKCRIIEDFDVKHIRSIYKSSASDHATIFLEIGLLNGKKIKSELHVGALPPDLEMALAPFLYGHQQIFYSGLTPKRGSD